MSPDYGAALGAQLDQLTSLFDAAHAAGYKLPTITAQCVAGLRVAEAILVGQSAAAPKPDAAELAALDRLAPAAGIVPPGEGTAPCVCGHVPARHTRLLSPGTFGGCAVRECPCVAVDVS